MVCIILNTVPFEFRYDSVTTYTKTIRSLQNAQATILSARQKVSMSWFGLGFRVWGLGFRAVIKSGFKRV